MNVGQSPERTNGKHYLLDKVVGALTGAFTTPRCQRFLKPPFIYIDLCAGDGNPSYFSETSSPAILQKHANWLRKRYGETGAVVILVEQDRSTFDKLSQSPYAQNSYLIHGNSKDPAVIAQIKEILESVASEMSPCFVHNDPNKVSDFAITSELLAVLPRYTTSLSTLGCNVGGLKRLELHERQPWFENVELLVDRVRSVKCHDAYLTSLRGDCAQWAYLLTCPKCWEEMISSTTEKAFKHWSKGLDTAWLSNAEAFDAMLKTLFLTKKELANVA